VYNSVIDSVAESCRVAVILRLLLNKNVNLASILIFSSFVHVTWFLNVFPYTCCVFRSRDRSFYYCNANCTVGSCPVILCFALTSLGGLIRSSSLYHTVMLCSLRGCKTKFRFYMKPRHAVMLPTVLVLLRIILNFLKGISFLYVGHSSVAILMTTHRRKIFYALWSTIQPTVWTCRISFAVEMDASLNEVRNLDCA
jgi:hypothetical protein